MSYIRNGEAYYEAVKTYGKIREWCKENNINDFQTMLAKLHEEKPDWAVIIETKPSAKLFFLNWFTRRHKYDALGKARTEGKEKSRGKNVKHDRRPVPCICTDTGEEFRSFTQAAKSIGVNSRQIMDCCYGVRASVKGHHFKLKESDKKDS